MGQIKYYKHLPCDNYNKINQEILAFVFRYNIAQDSQQFWNPIAVVDFLKECPLFAEWTKQTGVRIKTLSVTLGFINRCCIAHTDTLPARFKLSWPVMNTTNTYNRWFSAPDTATKEINSYGGITYLVDEELTELDRVCVDRPMIIDAGTIHDVWVDGQIIAPRIGLQCQLIKEPKEL
jgi:hypothetical protein